MSCQQYFFIYLTFSINRDHIDYSLMSPVIIPRGYTKDFVDGKIDETEQIKKIEKAFAEQEKESDIVLCEGTGHTGVGSIINLNNAQVASHLGCDMILVANGGLGSAFDELNLNYNMCKAHGVRLAGVIINKVRPDKFEQTKKYMSQVLEKRFGVPLLGCVPDKSFLGCPALADLEQLFNAKLFSGSEHRMRHYTIEEVNLVTTSLGRFLENLRIKPTRTMYVTHVTRNDIILGFLGEYQRREAQGHEHDKFESCLILCGRKQRYEILPEILDMIKLSNAPVLAVDLSTNQAMESILKFTPKLNVEDKNRVNEAVNHYEPYIDFDKLLERTHVDNKD
jgi:BioD-like phosphotransacetylase family protein